MTIKGFAAAQRHKGGFKKWCYDKIKAIYDVEIGDEDTEGTILYRIKQLEDEIDTGAGSEGGG